MLRWVVAGIGDIAVKRVIPAILAEPRSELCGVVTRDPQKATSYGVPGWTTVEEALHAGEFDALYVATPVALHAPQSIAALRAGRHVLCEKPVALNYADACEMERAAQETGRVLGIAYYRRTYAKVRRATELIEGGAIGRPVYVDMKIHSEPPDPARSWLFDPAMAGGGPLYDIASHRIDLLNYWFGKPVRATGQCSNVVHRFAVEDAATLLVEYECGVRGLIDARWHSKVFRDECRIFGTDGELDLTPLNGPRLATPLGEEHLPAHENLHYPCIAEFVFAVLDGSHLSSTITTAKVTDWVTEQVIRTA